MGIQDRDYYREGSSFLDVWGRQGVTVWLIAITCGVFFGQCILGAPLRSPLVQLGMYEPRRIMDGEAWRLLTSIFLHSGLWHLFWNMLVLYWVGTRLEEVYGRGEFVAFYLLAGIFANVFRLVAWLGGFGPGDPALGASGAVTAAFVVYALNFPHQRVLLYFLFPMPIWLLLALYIGFDILGAMGVGNQPIGYFAHLGGAVFGAVYFVAGFRFSDIFHRSPRERPRLRVVRSDSPDEAPTPVRAAVERVPQSQELSSGADGDDLEKRLDQVLAKVSKHGKDSLTPEEQEVLMRASERYKNRRK